MRRQAGKQPAPACSSSPGRTLPRDERRDSQQATQGGNMKRIDLSFLTLAALALLIGVGLGIYMGATQNFQYAPVHAHLNLVGWASLAIFGLTYRAYPALADGMLAKVHLLASGSGGLLLPLGIY